MMETDVSQHIHRASAHQNSGRIPCFSARLMNVRQVDFFENTTPKGMVSCSRDVNFCRLSLSQPALICWSSKQEVLPPLLLRQLTAPRKTSHSTSISGWARAAMVIPIPALLFLSGLCS